MTITEKYTTIRKKFADGHYWAVTYDQAGNKIGHKKWHSTQEKGITPNEVLKRETVNAFYQRQAKKEIPIQEWKNENFVVPSKTQFTDNDMSFPFSYEIEMKVELSNGQTIKKWVTVVNRVPLTKEEIDQKIKKMIVEDYHYHKLKSYRVKKLLLSKTASYKKSYKKPIPVKRKKVVKNANKSPIRGKQKNKSPK